MDDQKQQKIGNAIYLTFVVRHPLVILTNFLVSYYLGSSIQDSIIYYEFLIKGCSLTLTLSIYANDKPENIIIACGIKIDGIVKKMVERGAAILGFKLNLCAFQVPHKKLRKLRCS